MIVSGQPSSMVTEEHCNSHGVKLFHCLQACTQSSTSKRSFIAHVMWMVVMYFGLILVPPLWSQYTVHLVYIVLLLINTHPCCWCVNTPISPTGEHV